MSGPKHSRAPGTPSTVVLVISGPIARADVPALCDRVGALLEGNESDLVVCGVGALVAPDGVTVDALARMALTARRLGRRVRLHAPCGELQELLSFAGLTDAVPLCAGSAVEPWGEAEEREKTCGVQEEADSDDFSG